MTLFSLFQSVLLLFRIDLRLDLINMYILDTLYSMGYSKMLEGNTVFGALFYGVFGLVVLSFAVSSVMTLSTKRYPYVIVMFLYGIDAIMCLITASYPQFGLHAVVLLLVFFAFKNRMYLNMMKNNVWGYE